MGNSTALHASPNMKPSVTSSQSLGSLAHVGATYQPGSNPLMGSLSQSLLPGINEASWFSPKQGYLGSALTHQTWFGAVTTGYKPSNGPYFATPWFNTDNLRRASSKS